jgi:hypothetical protein
LLVKDEVDLVITMIDRKLPAGLQFLVRAELAMGLLVEKTSNGKSVDELLRRDKILEPLICLPAHETLTKKFWPDWSKMGDGMVPAVEASSADLIETHVSNGLGIGVWWIFQASGPGKRENVTTKRVSGGGGGSFVAW